MKYRKELSILSILWLLFFTFNLNTSVHAESTLPLNGTTTGKLAVEEEVIYTLTLKESGKLSLDFTSFGDDVEFKLIDDQDNHIMDEQLRSDGKTPAKEVVSYHLEPRNYRFSVKDTSYTGRTGGYTIVSSFKPSASQDVEPNNGTSEAQFLPFNQKVRGYLTEQDEQDVYRVVLPRSGRLMLDMSSYARDGVSVEMSDTYNNQVWSQYLRSSELTPKREVKTNYLEAGTYYLSFSESGTGIYELKATFEATGNNELEPNNGVVEAQSLPFYKKIKGLLSWSDSDDYYKIVLPKKSTVTLDYSSYTRVGSTIDWLNGQNESIFSKYIWSEEKKPGRHVEKRVLNKGTYYIHVQTNYEGLYLLQVKSSHLLPTLTINTVTTRSTSVSGTTTKNAKVTMQIGKKTQSSKADAKGKFRFKIAKQKVGTSIKVSSKNQYGTISKTIKVKK